MDKSCLSDKQVIEATRNYVCVRPATYEDEEEAELLASLARTRSGELENTVFALLAPDGKTKISRGARSIQRVFGPSNTEIAASLTEVSEKYKIKNNEKPTSLPLATTLRLALNVAACDNQPLVICLSENKATLTKIEQAVAAYAWGEKYLGQFHYVSSSSPEKLSSISGNTIKEGLLIVEPDRFGTTATVLAQLETNAGSNKIDETLSQGLVAFDRARPANHRSHRAAGSASGIHWKTAVPVTDSGRSPRR